MTVKRHLLPAAMLSLGIFVGFLPLLRTDARSLAGALNSKVKPGDVAWHPSFAAAREASECSGKPVLLFQLLGRLDDQFC